VSGLLFDVPIPLRHPPCRHVLVPAPRPRLFDQEALPPIFDMEFEWDDAPEALLHPALLTVGYGPIYSITMEPAPPRWRRIVGWPWDRWQAWRFDRRLGG
jgi:hypothetical protein